MALPYGRFFISVGTCSVNVLSYFDRPVVNGPWFLRFTDRYFENGTGDCKGR